MKKKLKDFLSGIGSLFNISPRPNLQKYVPTRTPWERVGDSFQRIIGNQVPEYTEAAEDLLDSHSQLATKPAIDCRSAEKCGKVGIDKDTQSVIQ